MLTGGPEDDYDYGQNYIQNYDYAEDQGPPPPMMMNKVGPPPGPSGPPPGPPPGPPMRAVPSQQLGGMGGGGMGGGGMGGGGMGASPSMMGGK